MSVEKMKKGLLEEHLRVILLLAILFQSDFFLLSLKKSPTWGSQETYGESKRQKKITESLWFTVDWPQTHRTFFEESP